MTNKLLKLITTVFSIAVGAIGCTDSQLDEKLLKKLFGVSLPEAGRQLHVYHLGHSLVGRDMPAMVQQLAGSEHEYRSQLGWGATLQSHWDPDVPINGFETENAHSHYQDVFEAIDSKSFDAVVLTEMVEIKDAIKYFDSEKYLSEFVEYISTKSPDSRMYLYESWHDLTSDEEWIKRLDDDYQKYWLNQILDKVLLGFKGEVPVYVIPVGQVMSAFFKEIKKVGGLKGLSGPADIFAVNDDGSMDTIHVNDLGNYLSALVHYAVLYRKSPEGLPHKLNKADGSPALAPSAEVAKLMQAVTWKVVSQNYRTGIIGFE